MALLTPIAITKAGIANISASLVSTDAAGDSVGSSSGIFLYLENAGVISHSLTVAAPVANTDCGNFGSLPVSDIVLTVAAGENGVLAIPLGYVDGSGNFSWTYDTAINVNIGVFSLAP